MYTYVVLDPNDNEGIVNDETTLNEKNVWYKSIYVLHTKDKTKGELVTSILSSK